jgi:hypothetical protein
VTLRAQIESAQRHASALHDAYGPAGSEHRLGDPAPLVADIAAAASVLEAVQAEFMKLVDTKPLESALSTLRAELAAVSAYVGELDAACN